MQGTFLMTNTFAKINRLIIIFFLFISLLFSSLFAEGQILNYQEIVRLQNLKSTEDLLYKMGLRNIGRKKRFHYVEMKRCDTIQVDCEWGCFQILGAIDSDYEKNNILFKNYEIQQFTDSKFAQNYNSTTKKATMFVEITEKKESSNFNCNNLFGDWDEQIWIRIQFNDKSDFNYLLSQITQNTTYFDTVSDFSGENTAVYRLILGTKYIKGYNKHFNTGIEFRINEYDFYGTVNITFKKIFRV